MTNEETKAYIAALLYEREGYARYGNDEGVKAVDEELSRIGGKAKAPSKKATKLTPKAGTEL